MNRNLFDHPDCPGVKVMDCVMQTTEQVNSWKATIPEQSPEGWHLVARWSGSTLRFTHERNGTPAVKSLDPPEQKKRGAPSIEDLKTKLGMKGILFPANATYDQLRELAK